ncbi:hypothetical protein AK812_SmicGene1496 [Symbiodinium microadriaticum]|uniref:Uncharacterized protein n=1 Tax=Symbiodinium microadriaticum TaxID=2951 RepID=A0A1Q9F3W2_SYMMI|nr:hypothetical protein AK812_SmicGene1496 [Symbiodinium microadriaticum]CAE7186133.1 unnamed protein product [Symbiodinium microadriaticum]
MQRLLRTAGADQIAICGLDNFRCSVCEEDKKPSAPAAVTMPEEYKFNKAISLDMFITLFHVAVIVGEGAGPPASSDMARALSACWLNWAGMPGSIVLDSGLEKRCHVPMAPSFATSELRVRPTWTRRTTRRDKGYTQGDYIKTTILSRQLRGRQNMEFVDTESVGVFSKEGIVEASSDSLVSLRGEAVDVQRGIQSTPSTGFDVQSESAEHLRMVLHGLMTTGATKEHVIQAVWPGYASRREKTLNFYAKRMAEVFPYASDPRMVADLMGEIPALDIVNLKYVATMMSAEILHNHVAGRLVWHEEKKGEAEKDAFVSGITRSQVTWA